MDLGFTWFDFAALVIVGLSAVMAFARGLIREVFSIIAFAAGVIAALTLFFAGMLRSITESITPLRGIIADLGGGLVVFLIVFITITVITSSLAKTAHQSTEIGSFDRAAGLAFGVLRGILFVSIFFVLPLKVFGPTNNEDDSNSFYREGVQGARTYPIYSSVADGLLVLIPRAQQRAHDIIERQRGESATIPPAQPATPQAPTP